MRRFLHFYLERGFALGLLVGSVVLLFLPFDLSSKAAGLVLALLLSSLAAAIQLRAVTREESEGIDE
jgi:hypothetical protein